MAKLIIGLFIELIIFLTLNKKIFYKEEDQYKNLIVFLLMCFFNFHISLHYSQTIVGVKNTFYVPSIFLAIVALFTSVVKRKSFHFRYEYVFLLLIAAHFIYSLVVFPVLDKAHYFYMVILLLSISMIILIYQSIKIYKFDKLLYYTNYLAIANGILAILQFITGKMLVLGSFNQSIFYYEGLTTVKRAVGIGMTNNAAGNLGAILFAVVLYNLLKNKDLTSLFSLIFTLLFSFLTLTRIGYVAIFVELVLIVVTTRIKYIKMFLKKKWSVIGLTLFLIVSLLVTWNKINYYLFQSRGDTLTSRFIQYRRVLGDVVSHNFWLGVGEARYQYYLYANKGIHDLVIHSQYLNVLAEQGCIIFIIFVFGNFYIIVYILRQEKSKLLKAFSLSLFIGNFICINFNPNQYYYINNIFYYFYIFGEYYKLQQRDANESKKTLAHDLEQYKNSTRG
ncbi:O-antigen ligase family protein [Sporolactobacillus shoreicorticis]|uniref:O-antigen ligase family protein n=1 Tax=Sporolactobacillus shoreicorticis TaxID=1923877 RepID=A0ABW5S2X6_9BACL|nr:O-antigen ligase family protein [Sporolactobacillus shoreicorticis]MCO7124181.1 O-antigen ligase family protein [Sporolactobacillus shoreicorticis]